MTSAQFEAITRHGQNLNAIFGTNHDPVALCKKLRRLENKAHWQAERYCNGNIDTDQWGEISDSILAQLDKILNFRAQSIPVYVNGDPRGYALKVKEGYVREHNLQIHTDWGGYGIIAPEIDKKGE